MMQNTVDKILAYKIFCLEAYKCVHHITGAEAYTLFSQYKVFDYLSASYDVLHSTGRLYVVEDIDQFIANVPET